MKKPASNSLRVIVSAACLALAVLANRAKAGTNTWDPQGANPQNPYTGSLSGTWESTNWDTTDELGTSSTANWVESSTALFAVNTGTGTPPFLVTMNSSHTVAGIFNGSLTPGPCSVTINGSGTMTIPSGVQSFDIVSPGTVAISNVIAGSGALVESGSGTLTLYGVNTYSGGTAIGSGCALTIAGAGKLGGGTYSPGITNAGIFDWASSASQTLSGPFSGAGTLIQGGGTLTLTATNTYTGGTTISSGKTLTVSGGGKLGNGTYSANITNNGTFNYNGTNSQTLNGTISGTGSLAVNPGGNLGNLLYLNGANTYTGSTTIADAGQIIITSDSSLGTPPASYVSTQLIFEYGFLKANGTFTLNTNRGIYLAAGSQSIGASIQVNPGDTLTLAAPITGTAGLGVIFGSGEPDFGYGTTLLAIHSTYTGPTAISTGTLLLGLNGALPSGTTLVMAPDDVGGSVFDLNGFTQTIGPLSTTNTFYAPAGVGTGTPTIELNNGTLTILQTNFTAGFNGVITGPGNLVINGNSSGELILSNADSFTGLTINGGTLDGYGNGSISSSVVINGGTFEMDSANALNYNTNTLTMGSGVTVYLNYSGSQTIAALYFGAAMQATGLWGATNNPSATYTDSRFTGSGLLLVCPAPQTITPATASVCAGSTTTASVPATPGATYSWSVGNGTIDSGGNLSTVTYTAMAYSPVTLNCVVTSSCGVVSPGNQNVMVPVNICGLIVQASNNVVYDPINGATITATGVLGANWELNASTNVSAPLPWPTIQSGTVFESPFTITDPYAIYYPQQFYYLTNSTSP